jgi:hypothetical protein
MAMKPAESKALMAAVGRFVCDEVALAVNPLKQQISILENRIAELEAGGFYRGVWQRCNEYAKGQMTTCNGSLWVAVENTSANEMPGQSLRWMLCAKGNGDGTPTSRKPTQPRALHHNGP